MRRKTATGSIAAWLVFWIVLGMLGSSVVSNPAEGQDTEEVLDKLCGSPPTGDSDIDVSFDVFLNGVDDGKGSGTEKLRLFSLDENERIIQVDFESTYNISILGFKISAVFSHHSKEYWRNGHLLICAVGTGKNSVKEPDVTISITYLPSNGKYEWRAVETGVFENDPEDTRFSGPVRTESFWMEPDVGDVTIVNLGRSAVYDAKFELLGDELFEAIHTRHYQLYGKKKAGGRAGDEGLKRHLWYDSVGLVRTCTKETYGVDVIAESVRTDPPPKAVDGTSGEVRGPLAEARSCNDIFNSG